MIGKREDELDRVLAPFNVAACVAAVLCTLWSGVSGAWSALVAIGSWLAWLIVLVALYFILVLLISLTVNMKAPPPKGAHPFYRHFVIRIIGLLCCGARTRIHTTGLEKLPRDGRFLLVSNHRSMYDPITTAWILRRYDMAFVTKPENLRIPLCGPMIYMANYLPINREDPRKAMETINLAAEHIKNDVASIGIYPEGTRSRTGELLTFHNGVFKIAQKANVPIIVMTAAGTENISKNFPWRSTDVYLDFCEALPAEEIKGSTAAVSDRVRAIFEENLARRDET